MVSDPAVQAHFDALRLAQLDRKIDELTDKDKNWQDLLEQGQNRGARIYADENWFAAHGSKYEARDAKQAAKEHSEHYRAMLDAMAENLAALRKAEAERDELRHQVAGGYQYGMELEVSE